MPNEIISQRFLKPVIRVISLLIFILILASCAALGTKTVHKADALSTYNFQRLGYSQLVNEEVLNGVIPQTSAIYDATMRKFFYEKPVKIARYALTDLASLDNLDAAEIKELCSRYELDGYIVTQIRYKFIHHSFMFIPYGNSEDVYVDMKLLDKNGTLVLQTKHNTNAGNSYMTIPTADQTVQDGTIGALKRIMKELEKSKKR